MQQKIKDLYEKPLQQDYPTIRKIFFVSQDESKILSSLFTTSKYDELVDTIFDEAMQMEIPRSEKHYLL